MKTYHLLVMLLLAAGLTIGCEDSSDSDDSDPFIQFTLDANCADELPNGVAITLDGTVIGTVMPGDKLTQDTSSGDHTWSAPGFGTFNITVPDSGFIQPLTCKN